MYIIWNEARSSHKCSKVTKMKIFVDGFFDYPGSSLSPGAESAGGY
jgi:hypothetical protein